MHAPQSIAERHATLISTDPTLTAELAEVDRNHPGWHSFRSKDPNGKPSGEMYASHSRSRSEMQDIEAAYWEAHPGLDDTRLITGSGVTVHAPTPEKLRYEIARCEHESRLAA